MKTFYSVTCLQKTTTFFIYVGIAYKTKQNNKIQIPHNSLVFPWGNY